MVRMHHCESWLAAFDKTTGELRWKVPRNYDTPVEGDHGYCTPLLRHRNGREELVVWGGQHLTLHDVSNGKVVWSFGDAFNPESKPNVLSTQRGGVAVSRRRVGWGVIGCAPPVEPVNSPA